MAVSVKEYLNDMRTISSSESSRTVATKSNLQNDVLLSDLIEAVSYAKSIESKENSLNETNKQIIATIKSQEKLIEQLIENQKLTEQQNKDLRDSIDKFYEVAKASKIDYKKYANQLEQYSLSYKDRLPESVNNRIVNDSRTAHMSGAKQNDRFAMIETSIKRIKYILEDSWENTKQFRTRLFVNLNNIKEGFLNKFDDFKDKFGELREKTGGIFGGIIDFIKNWAPIALIVTGLWKKYSKQFFSNDKTKTDTNIYAGLIGIKQYSQITKYFSSTLTRIASSVIKGAFKAAKSMMTKIPKSITNVFEVIGKSPIGKVLTTAAKVGKTAGLGLLALRKIPFLGSLVSILMAISRWKKGDYRGAFIEIASGLAYYIPVVGWIASIGLDLLNMKLDRDQMKEGQIPQSSGKKWYNPFSWFSKNKNSEENIQGEPLGDAPIKWRNESGGYSPIGLTSSAKNAAENFNRLIGGGLTVTSAFRDPSRMMTLWNSARPIPGKRNRINKYGNEMADPARSNHARGLAIDVPMSLYNKLGPSKFRALAKQAGFSLVYPEKTAVHLEVPKTGGVAARGNQKVSSDMTAKASAMEPIGEDQQAISSAGSASEEEVQTFADAMKSFGEFYNKVASFREASASQITDTQVPSISDMSAGTPSASISRTVETSGSIARASQSPMRTQSAAQTTKVISSAPETLTTDINDTDLALLNSIIFS